MRFGVQENDIIMTCLYTVLNITSFVYKMAIIASSKTQLFE